MVLDNFQTEHNNPCNDEGCKKESKNDGFIESVDIIEKTNLIKTYLNK